MKVKDKDHPHGPTLKPTRNKTGRTSTGSRATGDMSFWCRYRASARRLKEFLEEKDVIRVKITEQEYWSILNQCTTLICGMRRAPDTVEYIFDFDRSSPEYAHLCYLRAPMIDLRTDSRKDYMGRI